MTNDSAIPMKVVHKAWCCVLRKGLSGYELLAFEHPLAGRQIPKGTVEDGEDPGAAAMRELEEESGIKATRIVRRIAGMEIQRTSSRDTPETSVRVQSWHLYHLEVPRDATEREQWTHAADGSADERGLKFSYFWFPLSSPLDSFAPYWHQVLREVRDYCAALPAEELPRPSP